MISVGPVEGRLKGKVALVSGTAGGQGRAVALMFARAGATVYGADIAAAAAGQDETRRLGEAEDLALETAIVDVADEAAVVDWIEATARPHGGIDILYNNAGFAHFGPFQTISYQQWAETLRYELDVIFLPSRAAWPHMIARGGGVIINVASVSGMAGAEFLAQVPHSAGKGGVIGITYQMAAEGAPHGIRVNAISPGPIVTPATQGLLETDADFRTSFEAWPILGRTGRPDDVAYAALFLASDEAAFITAINLPVDGGSTGVSGRRAGGRQAA